MYHSIWVIRFILYLLAIHSLDCWPGSDSVSGGIVHFYTELAGVAEYLAAALGAPALCWMGYRLSLGTCLAWYLDVELESTCLSG